MPITVLCPGCDATLKAPDAAAGKKITCPQCRTAMLTPTADEFHEPDFEILPEEKPRFAATRSLRSEARDDDYEDERHRKRKFKKKKPSNPGRTALILGGGGLVVVLAICGGIWAIAAKIGGSKNTDPAKTNWIAFTSPDGSFSVSFPGESPTSGNLYDHLNVYNEAKLNRDKAQMAKLRVQTPGWLVKDGGRRYLVGYVQLPAEAANVATPAQMMQECTADFKAGSVEDGEKVVSSQPSTFAGHPSQEIVLETASPLSRLRQVMVIFVVPGGRMYFIISEGSALTPSDPMTKAFFEKFKLNDAGKKK